MHSWLKTRHFLSAMTTEKQALMWHFIYIKSFTQSQSQWNLILPKTWTLIFCCFASSCVFFRKLKSSFTHPLTEVRMEIGRSCCRSFLVKDGITLIVICVTEILLRWMNTHFAGMEGHSTETIIIQLRLLFKELCLFLPLVEVKSINTVHYLLVL